MMRRVVTAALLLPTFILGLWYLPTAAFGALCAIVIAIGAYEWGRIFAWHPKVAVAYGVASLTLCLVALFYGWTGTAAQLALRFAWMYLPAAIFWLAVVPVALGKLTIPGGVVARWMVGWLVLLPAWGAVVDLRQKGADVLLCFMGLVWLADSIAYFVGRRFGRTKLAPKVSPGKSIEGLIGALMALAAYGWALGAYELGPARSDLLPLPGWQWALISVMLGLISVGGDLFESLAKRLGGVKDSGNLLPGHGGALDRIDALTSTLPLAMVVLIGLRRFGGH